MSCIHKQVDKVTKKPLCFVLLLLLVSLVTSASKADVLLRVTSYLPGRLGVQTLTNAMVARGDHDIKKALPPARYINIAKRAIDRELGDDSAFVLSVIYKVVRSDKEREIWVVIARGGTWKASRPGSSVEVLMLVDGTVIPWEWQEEKDPHKKNG